MKKLYFVAIALVVLAAGCSDGQHMTQQELLGNIAAGNGEETLTVTNRGAVVPEPVVTTITVKTDGTIEYKSEQFTEFGDGPSKGDAQTWSAKLSDEDLGALKQAMAGANLLGYANLTDGGECSDSQGLSIDYSSADGATNSFSIEGGYACGEEDAIPAELNDLINMVEDLANKYSDVTSAKSALTKILL